MTFEFSKFINKNFEQVPVPKKKDYSGYINLSSNQLEASLILNVFNEFIENFDKTKISQYSDINLIKKLAQPYLSVNIENLLLTPGSDIFIYLLLDTLIQFNPEIIINHPNYQSYFDFIAIRNLPHKKINILHNNNDSIVNEYVKAIKRSKNSLIIISNPDNFIGNALSIAQLVTIIKTAYAHNSMIIIDEAYADFSQLDHHTLFNQFDNVIILKTLSKSFGLAGLRLCEVLSSPAIIQYFKKTGIEKACSSISLYFYVHLLKNSNTVHEIRDTIITNRATLMESLGNKFGSSIKIYKSNTNFVTIEFSQDKLASDFVNNLGNNSIIVKQLTLNNMPTRLVRMTVPYEDTVILRLLELINNYASE